MNSKKHLVVITGPTGSGKTDLSIHVAKHFGAPIISADSRQFYKGMEIGTAQPEAAQLADVPHFLIGTHHPTDQINCGRYETIALEIVTDLFRNHDIVMAVGGSGLYIDALCYGMDLLPEADGRLREELETELNSNGLESLLEQLNRLDPSYSSIVDRNNPKRVIRALEVCRLTGRPYSEQRTGKKAEREFNIIKIATELPREELYERINLRVDKMIAEGLENEARAMLPYREYNALQTVGYREFFDWFDGSLSYYEAVELIKRNSRRYAKRQMTWFRRDSDIQWVSPHDPLRAIEIIESAVEK